MIVTGIIILISFVSVFGDISYKPTLEKCELVSFNKDLIKDLKFDCHVNPGEKFSVSTTGDLLKPLNLDNIQATGQVYLQDGDKYVIQPKLTMTLNVCKEYKLETLGKWQEMEKYGNMKACGMLEPGNYHVKDFPPHIKLLDVPIKAGKYKLNVKMTTEGADVYEMDFFTDIKAM